MVDRGPIKADDRHTLRRIKTAMQGNVIRALAELVTNADDSYRRLEGESREHSGLIEILYEKDGHRGVFAVRDHAEGMSIDEVRKNFTSYGAATSGMKAGKRVRGYFGQGAKDALASMVDGRICTFKDGDFVECRLFIENRVPMYEIGDPKPATPALRKIHGISDNGTVAYFVAEPGRTGRVPQLNTVHEELANNCILRKIMTNTTRKVLLSDRNSNKTRRLRYRMPQGKQILMEHFTTSFDEYGDFPIQMSLWRAEKGELTQSGDDRTGGLLVVDDQDVVLDVSLFKFDNEPLAVRFFGEVRIGRFRELLDEEEAVLSEERDGLVRRHPFCRLVIQEIEKRIAAKVKEERIRKQKEDQSKIDREEMGRYRKACNILNEIAELEAQAVTNLGPEPTDEPEEPPNGLCLYPSSAQITVGKRYGFELRFNTKVVPHGSVVKASSTSPTLSVLTPEIKVSTEDGTGIVRKYITVQGKEPNIECILRASVADRLTEAKVFVAPEKELLFSEGIAFQPESLTLRPNRPRKAYLLVYTKIIEGGSTINLSGDNESIQLSESRLIVNEFEATRHVVKYELEVWGESAGENAIIAAECGSYAALLEVRVRDKEPPKEKSRKGMFNEPEFNYEPVPLQRTSYSAESGKVIIYVNFPSVSHYLGRNCEYRKTIPAQVLIADLVAERAFHEIAKKKVEGSGATLSPQAVPARIQRDAYELSRKYGEKVHQALVDQALLDGARHTADSSPGEPTSSRPNKQRRKDRGMTSRNREHELGHSCERI